MDIHFISTLSDETQFMPNCTLAAAYIIIVWTSVFNKHDFEMTVTCMSVYKYNKCYGLLFKSFHILSHSIKTASLRSTVERTYLHFNPPRIVPLTKIQRTKLIVFKIEIDVPAATISPSSTFCSAEDFFCTVGTVTIIVIIICAKFLPLCEWVEKDQLWCYQ